MIAVSNTSPISNLIQIGHLTLLAKLFTELWIPPEVASELDDGVEFFGDWRATPGATAIRLRSIHNQALFRELSGRAHFGEAAAITLAVEIGDPLLIIDDSEGRRMATTVGLRCIGTVGLLVASKRAGHVARVAPLLDALRARARFWISDDVLRRALELAEESPPAMGM